MINHRLFCIASFLKYYFECAHWSEDCWLNEKMAFKDINCNRKLQTQTDNLIVIWMFSFYLSERRHVMNANGPKSKKKKNWPMHEKTMVFPVMSCPKDFECCVFQGLISVYRSFWMWPDRLNVSFFRRDCSCLYKNQNRWKKR